MKKILGLVVFFAVVLGFMTFAGLGFGVLIVQRTQELNEERARAEQTEQIVAARPETLQLGLNLIQFFSDGQPVWSDPEYIFEDFDYLGIDAYRQLVRADLSWHIIEPADDDWQFEKADAVLFESTQEPIVTLFADQYASPTPPWAEPGGFQKTLGPEAKDYLATVLDRYAGTVKYWEIGNKMDYWRAAGPDAVLLTEEENDAIPIYAPAEGFLPPEQGIFLAEVAAFIRERDEDAVIVMPGMSTIDDDTLDTWFAGVLEGGGSEWFDVVNYHFYGPWPQYLGVRNDLEAFLRVNDLHDKPVWLSETGSSASATLTRRTDYPNSDQSQAADVFRRLVQAWGAGDQLALWRGYIDASHSSNDRWRRYGIRNEEGVPELSYDAFVLLSQELTPFRRVERLSAELGGEHIYKIIREDGEARYVAWGIGTFTVPTGMEEMVNVVEQVDEKYVWQSVGVGKEVILTDAPILIK